MPRLHSGASIRRIAQLLTAFHVSISAFILAVLAASQMNAPPTVLGLAIVLAACVAGVTIIWLAFKVYSLPGGLFVLSLLLLTSFMTMLPPLALFAVLGKLFIVLSVRDKAAKTLKQHAALADSTAVKSRFFWERRLVLSVIAILVSMVAYSAYLSISQSM